ncbi:amidohydrolase family protein [Nonomuraea sp. SBT364]|uniref:amidohydrolase family protein n=1 Tax=Nonomuraea sp. SBT364 TaxID=1580530 RepID=UPI0007C6E85A|nr:amidohydrolase family protein [Nonomuraea sp. SBT364]
MAGEFAVHAGSMFDGFTRSGPATVHVRGGRITAVDRTGSRPSDRYVVDLGADACLLPGLIDTHTHLAFDSGNDPVASFVAADDERMLTGMRAAARTALLAGITTVRDLGARDFLALTVAEETLRTPEAGPEILAAGPPITTFGGHCHFMNGEAEGRGQLIDAVRERHDRGCAVVKIMASGGQMTRGSRAYLSQYGQEDLRIVADEAHRLGLPVAAHAHGNEAITDALAAGVDTLEHVSFSGEKGIDEDAALVERLAGSGAFLSLTLGTRGTLPLEVRQHLEPRLDSRRKVHRELVRLGGRVVVGTDAGIFPSKPHDVLPHSVEELRNLGLPPAASLAAMTSQAAIACGVEGRKGRISAGADADFVVVGGDPLRDPASLLDVRAVFRAGVRVR